MNRIEQRAIAILRRVSGAVLPHGLQQRLIWWLRPIPFRGDAVECPCCGGSFSHFMSHRGAANVRCPRCNSMERHRVLWLWLDRHPEFLTGVRRVLHMAPEAPVRRRLAQLNAPQYITADLDSRSAAVHCDIQDLPFRDGWFDLVVCNHVLEHIPDDRRAMQELCRVLAPGGRAILLCPIAHGRTETLEDPAVTAPEDRLRIYGQEDHARLYGSDYVQRLSDAGFTMTVDRFLQTLDESTIARHGLARTHDLFEQDDVYYGVK